MYFSTHTIRPWPNKKLGKAATILRFLFGQAESYFFGRIVRLPDNPTHYISDTTSEIEIKNEEVEFLQFERQASEYKRTIFSRNEGETEKKY